jgi:hypothetical protein
VEDAAHFSSTAKRYKYSSILSTSASGMIEVGKGWSECSVQWWDLAVDDPTFIPKFSPRTTARVASAILCNVTVA